MVEVVRMGRLEGSPKAAAGVTATAGMEQAGEHENHGAVAREVGWPPKWRAGVVGAVRMGRLQSHLLGGAGW